jgi:hypothetical protein
MSKKRTSQVLIKLAIFWVSFLIFHFAYSWFPVPAIAVFSGTNESIMQHAKIGFFAYSFASLLEYFIWGRKQPNSSSFFDARILTSVVFPWIMFIVWCMAPAFYGKPMPTIPAEIIYANITLLMIGAILAIFEKDLSKIKYSKTARIILRVLWIIGMLEMVVFTFNLPWADFFRG